MNLQLAFRFLRDIKRDNYIKYKNFLVLLRLYKYKKINLEMLYKKTIILLNNTKLIDQFKLFLPEE